MLKKSPRNNVIIVKVEICSQLWWSSVPDALSTKTVCPICGYDVPVDIKHIKKAFVRCNDCGATGH